MELDREESLFPVGSMIYGGLAVLFAVLIATVFLGILTELGWTGTITWPNNSLFLLVLYLAVIVGSIMAGWRSHQNGWAVGIGVGVISSMLFLVLVAFLPDRINLGVFLLKSFITIFIGAFGGIIGVNLSGNKG